MTDQISTYVWPGQTHFGFGAAKLVGQEAVSLRASNVFIVTDPGIMSAGLLAPVANSLEEAGLKFSVYNKIPPNPDTDSVDAAATRFHDSGADLIVAIGGGSVIDASKGIRQAAGCPPGNSIGDFAPLPGRKSPEPPARRDTPPMIAIPTTAGTGAEVTPWGVLTDLKNTLKFGVGGPYLVPDIALIDPGLTLTLPPKLTAATGLDALSHCIEAYVSTNDNPALDPMILEGISLIGENLRQAVAQPSNRQARRGMMLASMIGGIAISSKWLGACHSLAHQLSSFAEIHHGVAIALMLPHQMTLSLKGAPERYCDIADALNGNRERRTIGDSTDPIDQAAFAVEAVSKLISDVGLPTHLSEVGISEELIPAMANNAYLLDGNWPTNPCKVSEADFVALYQQAF